MADKVTRVKWQSWDGASSEELSLRETRKSIFASSTIIDKSQNSYSAAYMIECSPLWQVRKVRIEIANDSKTLELESDVHGRWQSEDDARPELTGAADIDINATPFTNTIPIRRLKLKENQTEEITVVYITLPELGVSVENQRYTCLIPDKLYRFHQPGTGFTSEIETDKNGLVLIYPGLYRRIQAASV